MARMEPLEMLEKIRNDLILLAKKVKNKDITPTVGNSVANIYKAALYAEQIRTQREADIKQEPSGELELSQVDRDRLDEVAALLSGEKIVKKNDEMHEAVKQN